MLQGPLSQLLQIRTSYCQPPQTAFTKYWRLLLVSWLFCVSARLGDARGCAGGRMAAAKVTPVP